MDIAEQKAAAEQAARARDLTRKELDILGPLVDRGISPKLEFLRVQQRVQELEAQRERALLAVPRLEASHQEFERKVEETVKEFRNSAKRLLSEKRSELATTTRPVVTKKRKVESNDIRAPIDGEILNAAAPGAVVGEGQTVAVIAPPVVARFIEGRVPKDAGVTLRRNQQVVVSFGHGQNLGRVDAVIAKVSSAAVNSAGGGENWAITLRVDAGSPGFEKLAKIRGTVRITATAEQPILDYLWNRISAASGGRIGGRLTGN